MLDRLKADHARFRDVVKGKVREDLKKFLSSDDFWARPGGGGAIKIKVPDIEIPHIVYGRDMEGVGQGEGELGDVIGTESPQGPCQGGGGQGGGEHGLEVEFSYDDLAEIIAHDLELPRLEPKGKKTLTTPYGAYTGVRPVGPESLLIVKRSYRRALKRSMASGRFNAQDPRVILEPTDKRYRAQHYATRPYASAFVALLRDISGSMDDDFNHVVRIVSRLFDFWVHHHYKGGVDVRYFLHDTNVFETTQPDFYRAMAGGGTMFTPAYKHISQVIDQDYPPRLWNNYVLHFTDGDPFGGDKVPAVEALRELVPKTNLTAYFEVGQLEMAYSMWGVTHNWKRENLFSGDVKPLVEELAPLFRISSVESPDQAYEKFREVLK